MALTATPDIAGLSVSNQPLSQEELRKMNAYWRAANYLSVGQIYLYANPLLREDLRLEHVKPRLLGHWGTTPGLNFIYVHFNRLIKKYDLNVIYVCGPGHGGPAMVANTYLEGTYTELYSGIQQNEEGMRKLFKQFSFPGGIPSHNAPETPGSIHEGGELGYALVHAYGAVLDKPYFVEGDEHERMHQLMAATLNTVIEEIRAIQDDVRGQESTSLPVWPIIILRTPKGWTGP